MRTCTTLSLLIACAFSPTPASAFCGFYVSTDAGELKNDASVVVLMRLGDRTVVSMRNDYRGPVEDFALVVPVPEAIGEEQVRTLSHDAFDRIERLAGPRLVEYWERDPCWRPRPVRTAMRGYGGRGRRGGGSSGARGSGGSGLGAAPPPVTVAARFAVDEYDVVILDAESSTGLETWLRTQGYRIPEGAATALRPYVEAGSRFFVARVDASRVRRVAGRAVLSPLRFHYRSEQFALPIRLGRMNADGAQDVVIHVLSREGRFEVANRDNVTMPTNLVMRPRAIGSFGRVYATMLDRVFERHPGAVVTEYAWRATGCDPCPTAALAQSDLRVFGADVLEEEGPSGHSSLGWTLTRLHARVDADEASDLVFRPADGIVGGRGAPFRSGAMRQRVDHGQRVNTFQARYAVLHRWSGAMTCEAPRRGRWGGPPSRRRPAPRSVPRVERSSDPVRLVRYLRTGLAVLRRRDR